MNKLKKIILDKESEDELVVIDEIDNVTFEYSQNGGEIDVNFDDVYDYWEIENQYRCILNGYFVDYKHKNKRLSNPFVLCCFNDTIYPFGDIYFICFNKNELPINKMNKEINDFGRWYLKEVYLDKEVNEDYEYFDNKFWVDLLDNIEPILSKYFETVRYLGY